MSREELTRMVNEELTHIPRGELPQNLLRSSYNIMRRKSLSKNAAVKKTCGEVLRECIADLQEEKPNAKFAYDEAFFGK